MKRDMFEFVLFCALCFALLFASNLLFKRITDRIELKLDRMDHLLREGVCDD